MVVNGPEGCLKFLPKFIGTLSNSIERYFYDDPNILYMKISWDYLANFDHPTIYYHSTIS